MFRSTQDPAILTNSQKFHLSAGIADSASFLITTTTQDVLACKITYAYGCLEGAYKRLFGADCLWCQFWGSAALGIRTRNQLVVNTEAA